jgi:hypothetical protein
LDSPCPIWHNHAAGEKGFGRRRNNLNRRPIMSHLGFLSLFILLPSLSGLATAHAADQPNVVLILADDK